MAWKSNAACVLFRPGMTPDYCLAAERARFFVARDKIVRVGFVEPTSEEPSLLRESMGSMGPARD